MKTKMSLKEWLPLIGMTISAFLVNTSEFMPIGLLTDISNDFNMTAAQAGVMITAYSWTVTILSLPLMLLACKIEPKKLLLGTLTVFSTCQVLSVISIGFPFLVVSRIGVACAHSIFWAIASPLAVRVVSKEHQSKALSAIITGTAIAMVLGMPLGRMIGLQIGWRMTFLCVAVISFLVLVYLAFVFPKIENTESFSINQLPELFKNSRLMITYIITFLFATGYYTTYSYIEPFLQRVAGFPSTLVTITLMLFGVAGLSGSYLFSRYYDDHRFAFVQAVLFGFAGALGLLYPASINMYMIILVCAIWGIAAMAFQTSFQAEIIGCVSTAASSVAMAIFSAIFNLGIGSGTWLGGVVYTNTSLNFIGFVGAMIVLVAAFISFIKFRSK
ncbi:MFS transporter [Catenibacterium sp. AM22-15]|uniref:MFS transporter n=1 Tax=Catenibacterium TaxID=135858 RepID=UPI000E3F2818|nr:MULTISPECIES: MFS transporter [unclassified Catenibacterium]RGE99577.1 MFS transporter [Catenibacterium sp. AM22-6LB]RGF09551.1 MFS transporter [Catenibacterium sp. AM22-15]HCV47383.1 sugar transporter [Catenibacterium sp.]